MNHKLEELDFDKDHYSIVGNVLQYLQEYDKISRRKTLNVLRPKLEAWLQSKLVNIREVAARCILFETWTPVTEVIYILINCI